MKLIWFLIIICIPLVLASPDLPAISENPGKPASSPSDLFPPFIFESDDGGVGTGGSINISYSNESVVSDGADDVDVKSLGDVNSVYDVSEDLVDSDVSSISGDNFSDGDSSDLSSDVVLKKKRSSMVLFISLIVIVGVLAFVLLTRKKR